MDLTKTCITGRDRPHDRLATLRAAMLHWPDEAGSDEITAAQGVLERLESTAPPKPTGTERDLVQALAGRVLAAAIAGEPCDLITEARAAVDRFDLDRVAYAAHQGAIAKAKAHLGAVVLAHAERAYRGWSARAAEIGATYAKLGSIPAELDARRAGGAALKRWEKATELREEWNALSLSWRALRMLRRLGDASAFATSARVLDRNGHSVAVIERQAQRAPEGSTFLDTAAVLGLTLVLDSAADQAERELRWKASDEARRVAA